MTNQNSNIETPTVYVPSKNRNRILWSIGIVLLFGVIVNCYFLMKNDSVVERAYYIPMYEPQQNAYYEQILVKDAVISTKDVLKITEDATLLDPIDVQIGDTVLVGDVLAYYNAEKQEETLRKIEAELNAYQMELNGLEMALSEVEYEASARPPTSRVNSNQIEEYVSVEVQMEIEHLHTTSEAKALLQRYIAETERNIAIKEQALQEVMNGRMLLSPIDGSIANIEMSGGSVTFEIHSSEKNVTAYVTEEEWRDLEIGQTVSIDMDWHDKLLFGQVADKRELPATSSPSLNALQKEDKIKKDELVYELQIDVNNAEALAPFGSIGKATISIFKQPDSYITLEDWTVEKEVELVSDEHHYVIGYDGKIRLVPIAVMATAEKKAWRAYDEAKYSNFLGESDGIEETEDFAEDDKSSVSEDADESENTIIANSEFQIAKQQVKSLKERADALDVENLSAFSAVNNEDWLVLIDNEDRRIGAPAFTALPSEKFSLDNIKPLTWKDILKYLFY